MSISASSLSNSSATLSSISSTTSAFSPVSSSSSESSAQRSAKKAQLTHKLVEEEAKTSASTSDITTHPNLKKAKVIIIDASNNRGVLGIMLDELEGLRNLIKEDSNYKKETFDAVVEVLKHLMRPRQDITTFFRDKLQPHEGDANFLMILDVCMKHLTSFQSEIADAAAKLLMHHSKTFYEAIIVMIKYSATPCIAQLIASICLGDHEIFKKCLQSLSFNAVFPKTSYGLSPIHFACLANHWQFLRTLSEYAKRNNIEIIPDELLLNIISKFCNFEIVKLLHDFQIIRHETMLENAVGSLQREYAMMLKEAPGDKEYNSKTFVYVRKLRKYYDANFLYLGNVIAAAAPVPHTSQYYNSIEAFVNLIWEHNVSLIVMVTNVRERQDQTGTLVERCVEYWKTNTYGSLKVNLISEEEVYKGTEANILGVESISMRVIEISNQEGISHKIHQLQYNNWPDGEVISAKTHVVGIKHAVTLLKKNPGKMLVHCLAGKHRTAIFIAGFMAAKIIGNYSTSITPSTTTLLRSIRQSRGRCVILYPQYSFIHQIINYLINEATKNSE